MTRSIDEAWLYDGGSPGPWLCVGDDGAVLAASEAIEGRYSMVKCELCETVRSRREPGHWEAAREHWESHALPAEDGFDVFRLPGAGCTKAKASGGWVAVFLSHPELAYLWSPVPPRIVAADMAAKGWSDAGMGGGVEWPRAKLSGRAYRQVADALVRRGHELVTAPAFVVDEESYTAWRLALRLGCSVDAVNAFLSVAGDGNIDLPIRQWVARHDAL